MKQVRKPIILCSTLIVSLTFSACEKNKYKTAMATLSATTSATAVSGTLTFYQQENSNNVKMELEVLVPSKANQSVAIHFHQHGDCGNAGNNTHGHWNPTKKLHGQWGVGEFHVGDIGNIPLDATGKGLLTLETDLWSIGGSDTTKNIVGKSIIVHAGVDDYVTQPTGNSGARIGCGVVQE